MWETSFFMGDLLTLKTSQPLCNANSQKACDVCCSLNTRYSVSQRRLEPTAPVEGHVPTHPAAPRETPSRKNTTTTNKKKQLTCYNLHVVFCFCPGSFCKTRPFLHCSGPAVVLRGQKTQQTPLYSLDTFPLKITSCYVKSLQLALVLNCLF